VLAAVCVAAVTGDQIGYLFGRRVGPALFDRPRSRLFNPKHVVRARTFFEQHGPRTILLARFVPIVRTFAPIVAGVGSMDYATFVTYNVAGGLAWGTGVTLAGYFLGEVDFVRGHIELVLIGLVALSFVPVTREALEARRRGPDRDGQADR
jgi:membrane-associated protein